MASKYKNKKSYSKKNDEFQWGSFLRLLPVYLTVGLLPFMMRLHVYNHNLSQFPWYYANANEQMADFFLYYRQWWFTAIAFYMLIVLLIKFMSGKKSLRFSIACLPMGVFALFAFLSAVLSEYRSFCFSGSFEQFENVFVLMGYALIVYYSLIVIESVVEVKRIIYVLTGSTLSLSLIGAMQTFKFDLLQTEFVKSLVVPANINASMSTTVSDQTAYMTLYNPNYVGVYVAMLFPLFAVLLLFTACWKERIAYAATLVLLLITLYGSGSKAGFLVIAVEMLILLVFMRRPILKFWYLIIPAATALVAVFLLINQARDYEYTDRIANALKISPTEYSLESIETKDDAVYIKYKGNELRVSMLTDEYGGYSFVVLDEDNQLISAEPLDDGSTYRLLDERFEGFEVYLFYFMDYVCVSIKIEGHEWQFTNEYSDDGSYYYLTTKGKFDKLHMAEQVIFSDYERAFSGRGYIWSVSIPLLKKHFFLGSGADTFVMTYPQQDYLRLWRNGFSEQVMSKPHSLYLQVGVQNGVIALIGMVAFFVMYLLNSVRLYINTRFENFYEQAGVAVMLAVLGFAVMGISNDSSVTVSPVFWAIAGLGVYLNHKSSELKKARKIAAE